MHAATEENSAAPAHTEIYYGEADQSSMRVGKTEPYVRWTAAEGDERALKQI